ncbi:sigma-70 family RNA polymerase sigma factor [Burkholderia sp. Ac-20379]|uniref:sigma-70 family RNA polymerase sigma factor n=1 Tax=Burkholderia sp. Ac-20379 TaxID=2703900 RepID=UPI001F11D019|nr:sigma-70 family RNA polymerase sigma factor [Burkholderia sp. Ac-20379]
MPPFEAAFFIVSAARADITDAYLPHFPLVPSQKENDNDSHYLIVGFWQPRSAGSSADSHPPPVVERYYRELLRFLSHRVRDLDTASDIAQESYLRVLALRGAGTVIDDARGLLYQTARNLVTDSFRRNAVRARHLEPLDDGDAHAADAASQPEQALEASQRTQRLLAAIEGLPPRCREAFVLHRFEGLGHAEIAERMGISRNMVEKHVIRAVLACRQQLAAWDGSAPDTTQADD